MIAPQAQVGVVPLPSGRPGNGGGDVPLDVGDVQRDVLTGGLAVEGGLQAGVATLGGAAVTDAQHQGQSLPDDAGVSGGGDQVGHDVGPRQSRSRDVSWSPRSRQPQPGR
ncbi:hypothetical protein [Nonomuraea zeae]|uniref:Uncharacterized protein n=1 Tax=Nonomuraea zeae TaxID=1642303 RepID=A0A5S4FZI9_9ACTN|nr:hypothetical protein [Nonomuraea zeae]TMR25694.1 hypothetical protein ETD85_44995 [Nonomuraea zeae]